MSFAIVFEGVTLITYMVILSGGKQKRESGWPILSGLHFIVGALQLAGMAIIVSALCGTKQVWHGCADTGY
jgi:formate hydrogenlyase subunit 3/multisubunit Na+/H+ antiporter MnhD subunit